MPRTLADVITDSRALMQDEEGGSDGETYRESDAKIISALNNAVSDARRLRPDLFLPATQADGDDLETPPTLYTTADLTPTPPDFPIEEIYYTAVIDYIVGWISLSDDEYVSDGRATALLNRFTQKLTARGA